MSVSEQIGRDVSGPVALFELGGMHSPATTRRPPPFLSIVLPCLLSFFFLVLSWSATWAGPRTDWAARAARRLAAGDREGALRDFQRASWQRPQDPALHFNMAVLAESLGRLEEAVQHYSAYLRWNPEAEDGQQVKRKIFRLCGILGARAYGRRDYPRALDWYERARMLFPLAKAVYFNMSRVYEAERNWREAAECLKEFYGLCTPPERKRVKSRIARFLRREAEVAFSARDFETALRNFREAAKWDEQDASLLLYQARCEEALGRLEEAKDHYLSYLQVEPGSPERKALLNRVIEIHLRLAEKIRRRGSPKAALDILDKALEIDPEEPRIHALLAKTYEEIGESAQAIAHLERILRVQQQQGGLDQTVVGNLVRLCTVLADEAYRQGKYADARRLLNKALSWAPDNSTVTYNLAKVCEKERDWEESILAYRRYLFLEPDAAERNEVKAKLAYYYSYLGSERFAKGEYAQAQEAFEQALLVKPEDPTLLYNLAMVLLKRGKTREALGFLERYLRRERDREEVRRVQAQMNRLITRMEEARRRRRDEGMTVGGAIGEGGDHGGWKEILGERERGYLFLRAGRWKEALARYKEALHQHPALGEEEAFRREIAALYREIGRNAMLEGDRDLALKALGRAEEWSPGEAFPYLWRGGLLEGMGEEDGALRLYESSLRRVALSGGRRTIRTKIFGILTGRIQEALQKGDLEGALRWMNELEPYLDDKRAADLDYERARLEEALGRKEAARLHFARYLSASSLRLDDTRWQREFERLLDEEGTDEPGAWVDPRVAIERGRRAYSRREFSRALLYFLIAARDGGRGVIGEIRRCLDALGRPDLHLEVLSGLARKGVPVQLTPEEKKRLEAEWARSLREDYRRGTFERGMARVRRIRSLVPGGEGTLAVLQGVFAEKIGEEREAMELYGKELDSPGGLSASEQSYVKKRLAVLSVREALRAYTDLRYEVSLRLLERAERLDPGRRDVAFDLGCVYLRLKRPREALRWFETYLEAAPGKAPRALRTRQAVALLRRRLGKAPVVRYGGEGIAVDLIFESPATLGRILAGGNGEGASGTTQRLLDEVLLAPYLESRSRLDGAAEEIPLLRAAGGVGRTEAGNCRPRAR